MHCDSAWFAAAEAGFLGVNARTGGRASLAFDDTTLPGAELQITGGTGLEDFTVAPRVALGYQLNARWGILGRYWNLSQNDEGMPSTSAGTANLDGFSVVESARVRLDAVDLEAVRSFTPGLWQFDASAGARHANLDESAALSADADFAGPSFARAYLSTTPASPAQA
jgi:hypothetical protein